MIDTIYINLILLFCNVRHSACYSWTWFKPYWDDMLCVCMKMIEALGLISFIQNIPENYILREPPWVYILFSVYHKSMNFEPTCLFLSWWLVEHFLIHWNSFEHSSVGISLSKDESLVEIKGEKNKVSSTPQWVAIEILYVRDNPCACVGVKHNCTRN